MIAPMSQRLLPVAIALLLVLTACSEAPTTTAVPDHDNGATSEAPPAPSSKNPRKQNEKPPGGEGKHRSGDATRSGAVNRGPSTSAQRSRGPGGRHPGPAPAPYPAAGAYRYAQQGFEEYCQRASCQRYELPARQTVNFSYERRSRESATIVSDARISRRRSMTTTTRYTKGKVLITHVVADFELQGGFTYSTAYQPDPPVEALRTPLEVGATWSGTWKDTTSGDYAIRVAGRDQIAAAGRRINAFRLDTRTNFRGEFTGRADLVVWVDPITMIPVKTIGKLRLSSTYGDFNSDFEVTLTSGPSYG